MKEIWKPCPRPYESAYEVSNLGIVRCYRYGNRVRKFPRIKNLQRNKVNGYWYVILSLRKVIKAWTIHRLVLTVFKGPQPKKDARHLDGDKANNKLSNLAWGTRKENEADKRMHGRSAIGERNGQSKLTESEVRDIRRKHKQGRTTHSISQIYGVCQQNISSIVLNKTWRNI